MNMKHWIPGTLGVTGLLLIYVFASGGNFLANFLSYIALFVIASHGWNLLGGYIGEISFGHAVFFGIGAYTVGLPLGYGLDLPLGLLVVLGAFTASLFALMISFPLLRVQGFPFLVGTYGLGVVMQSIFIVTPALFATRGIFIPAVNKYVLYTVSLTTAALVTFLVRWLVEQNLGLRFRAVRDVPIAAQMVGINIYRTKAAALVIGAGITGLAGGLFALYGSFVNPVASFGFATSISILLGPYIGGIGTVPGAVLGTIIVIMFQEFSRSVITVNGGHYLLLGLLLVLVMMTSKEGIYPGLKKLLTRHLAGRLPGARQKAR